MVYNSKQLIIMKYILIFFLFISASIQAQDVPSNVRGKLAMWRGRLCYNNGVSWIPIADSSAVTASAPSFATVTGQPTDNANLSSALSAKQATITNGLLSGTSSATVATTGAQTVSMTTPIVVITPTGATTLNASGGVIGQRVTFIVTTSGVSSFVVTFGTNFRTVGTLATGTTTARKFCISFIFDGVQWIETGRTTSII